MGEPRCIGGDGCEEEVVESVRGQDVAHCWLHFIAEKDGDADDV